MEEGFALRADAGNHSDRKRIEELLNFLRQHDREPVRLLMARGDLGDELVRADANGTAESFPFPDFGFELGHVLCCGLEVSMRRNVEISFVDARLFKGIRRAFENLHDAS